MEYEIIRSNRKTLAIEITKEARVIVRAPFGVSVLKIRRFLKEREDWIEKHLEKVKERPDKAEISQEQLMELARQAKKYIPLRVAYFAGVIGVDYGRISIRHQKTRWGSCSGKGNLNFNCLLMLMPPEIIDYVVVHELCHRKEMNHSKEFWTLVETVLPDYKARKKWLKDHGNAYM